MAAVVYPTPGKLYLTPTTVTGTTGTELEGIEERAISLSLEAEVRVRRSGVGTSAGFRSRHGRIQPARLQVPLRRQDTTALKILFSHLTTDGAAMRPTGGTAALEFAKLPTFALILRPDLDTEKYIYSPNWALSRDSVWAVLHNDRFPQLENCLLELIANRPTNATGPAHEWAAAATIASVFGLTENPA